VVCLYADSFYVGIKFFVLYFPEIETLLFIVASNPRLVTYLHTKRSMSNKDIVTLIVEK
jgi:hypothetical protein